MDESNYFTDARGAANCGLKWCNKLVQYYDRAAHISKHKKEVDVVNTSRWKQSCGPVGERAGEWARERAGEWARELESALQVLTCA